MDNLNLARKWRPKTFDQIVGQQISVRMLLNGLFLNKLFPVYLFAGQRGCGKTTTARIFSAAVNCRKLKNFQENPNTNKVPCLECDSCNAMQRGNHPDFIEIDAASNTGVDNVRQIIDSSSYMPLLGNKKIYLIDEAHMLSKAAFNALLKILEEPPASVLFILATTDVPKVPATVLSRCFQVIFTPLESFDLHNHLKLMCEKESISIDDIAIDLIIAETEGSARDAINLLERVRFSQSTVTQATILSVLGKISLQQLCSLFDSLLSKDPEKVLLQLNSMKFETLSAQNLWDMLIELCRALLWIKYGIKDLKAGLSKNFNELSQLAQKCSINRLHAIFQLFWTQEELFSKTNKKHVFLEMVLLQICEQTNILDVQDILNIAKNVSVSSVGGSNSSEFSNRALTGFVAEIIDETETLEPVKLINSNQNFNLLNSEKKLDLRWDLFLQKIMKLDDPMLSSILVQAIFIKFDENSKKVNLQLSNSSKFFKDKIEESKSLWLVSLQQDFNQCVGFNFIDVPVSVQPGMERSQVEKVIDPASRYSQPQRVQSRSDNRSIDNSVVDIKDKEKWPLANLLTSHFPGVVKKSE